MLETADNQSLTACDSKTRLSSFSLHADMNSKDAIVARMELSLAYRT